MPTKGEVSRHFYANFPALLLYASLPTALFPGLQTPKFFFLASPQ